MFVSHGGLSPGEDHQGSGPSTHLPVGPPTPPPFDSPLPCYNTATLSTALLARCAGSIHSQRLNRLPFHSVGTQAAKGKGWRRMANSTRIPRRSHGMV